MIERIVSKLVESNVFVVSNGNNCFIVDAGVELDKVKAIVGNKKVEALFLTHGHYDHCFYVQDYAEEFGCKVYCREYAKEYLQNPKYNYSDDKLQISDFSNFCFLNGNGEVCLPHFNVKYFVLGGHSKSDMGYVFGEDVFVGDVLIGRDMGRIDLYGGDKSAMKASLEYLRNLDYKTMFSGHGEENSKPVQDKVANLWIKFLSR